MSIIATAVRHLMAAGVTGDALVQAIADMEAAQPKDSAAERRRAWDRERKRKARDNSTGNPVEQVENAESAEPSPSLAPSPFLPPDPQPTPAPTPTPARENAGARKGTRLAADWQPKPLPADLAGVAGLWAPGVLERELSKFRDWAAAAPGGRGVKRDWDAAWRNWLRKADEQHGRNSRQSRFGDDDAPRNPIVRAVLARQAADDDQFG